jgi:hypothetical protein
MVFRRPDNNEILYQTSADGQSWSAPAALPGIVSGVARPYDTYDMVTDSAGHVHVVLVGYPSGSAAMSLIHSEWNGSQWLAPQVVTSGAPFPEYPKLAIGQGNKLHLIWFGGNRETIDRDGIGIWYSAATSSAPARSAVARAPAPAATPTVAADQTRTAAASSAARSPSAVSDPAAVEGPPIPIPQVELLAGRSDLTTLAALLPTVLLLGNIILRVERKHKQRRVE